MEFRPNFPKFVERYHISGNSLSKLSKQLVAEVAFAFPFTKISGNILPQPLHTKVPVQLFNKMIVLPCFQRRGDDNPCDLLTQRCVNTAGSYRCVNLCASGLRHDPRTRECVDIDECQERNVRCQGGKVSQNCSKRQGCLKKADSSLVYNTNVPN